MPIDDIRQFVMELEKVGELKRIKTEVDTNLEIAEILRRMSYTNGPAILFENVKGYEMPVLGNAFGSVKVQTEFPSLSYQQFFARSQKTLWFQVLSQVFLLIQMHFPVQAFHNL